FRNGNRTAERESELVPLEGILRRPGSGKRVVFGVQFVVAQEVEERAVVLVASWLGRYVNLGGLATELRGIDATLHFEFLQGVDRGKHDEGVEVGVGVLHAIQGEAVVAGPLTGYGNAFIGADATLTGASLAGRRKSEADVGSKRREIQIV